MNQNQSEGSATKDRQRMRRLNLKVITSLYRSTSPDPIYGNSIKRQHHHTINGGGQLENCEDYTSKIHTVHISNTGLTVSTTSLTYYYGQIRHIRYGKINI